MSKFNNPYIRARKYGKEAKKHILIYIITAAALTMCIIFAVKHVHRVGVDEEIVSEENFEPQETFEIKPVFVEVIIGENIVKINGETEYIDAMPYIQTSSNSTMIPLRFVSIALGQDGRNEVFWDADNKTATIIQNDNGTQRIISFSADSQYMIIDGMNVYMDNGVYAEIVDGRMYVPFRMLGAAMNAMVYWDNETKTASFEKY